MDAGLGEPAMGGASGVSRTPGEERREVDDVSHQPGAERRALFGPPRHSLRVAREEMPPRRPFVTSSEGVPPLGTPGSSPLTTTLLALALAGINGEPLLDASDSFTEGTTNQVDPSNAVLGVTP
jgi:hypothetical protein